MDIVGADRRHALGSTLIRMSVCAAYGYKTSEGRVHEGVKLDLPQMHHEFAKSNRTPSSIEIPTHPLPPDGRELLRVLNAYQ